MTLMLPISAKADSTSVDTGFHYVRGDFGTENSTTYISTPLHIKSQPFKYLTTEITIPYIYQKRVNFFTIGGRPGSPGHAFGSPSINSYGSGKGAGGSQFQNQQGGAQANKNGPPFETNATDQGKAAGIDPNGPILTESLSESVHGIGDIYLLFSSDLHDFFNHFSPYVPTIDFSAGIKLPTAETEKGLGTGEYDYTLGLTLTWVFGKAEYYLYGDYTWAGDMPDEAFENVFCFGGGTEIDLSSIYMCRGCYFLCCKSSRMFN